MMERVCLGPGGETKDAPSTVAMCMEQVEKVPGLTLQHGLMAPTKVGT
jgi:hypothetical protein